MSKEARAFMRLQLQLATLRFAETHNNTGRACRTFSVSRASFYRWKAIYQETGEEGLKQRQPIAKDHPRRIPEGTVAKVIELRTKYNLGQRRIGWYLLEPYHGICQSRTSIHGVCRSDVSVQDPHGTHGSWARAVDNYYTK